MLFARATLRAGGPPGKISRTNGARSAVAVHTQPQAFWLAVTHPRSVARRCVLAAGHCECAQRPWGPYCPRWEMGCNSGSRYFAANSLTCAMVTGRHGLSRTAVREARKSGGPGGPPGERIGLTLLIWPTKSTLHDPRRLARSILRGFRYPTRFQTARLRRDRQEPCGVGQRNGPPVRRAGPSQTES